MEEYPNIYPGADFGFDASYPIDADYGNFVGYRTPASTIGLATDARTANQIKATSEKLNTGAVTVDVQSISPDVFESIPQQHLKEINRMKKLAGVDFTFHGPLIEATGFTRDGWSQETREQAERQMWSALERSHDLDPDGNLVATFHTTTQLPELRTRIMTPEGEKTTEMLVIDERTGSAQKVAPKKRYLQGKTPTVEEDLDKMNKENWERSVANATFHGSQGLTAFQRTAKGEDSEIEAIKGKTSLDLYKISKTEKGIKYLNSLDPKVQQLANNIIHNKTFGEVYIKEAYNELQDLFDQAWYAAEKAGNNEDIDKLKKFQNKINPQTKNINNVENLPKFADTLMEGFGVLNTLKEIPQIFKPMDEFANDKASETYANVALKSYKKFKDTAPIISLENPPAGGGISRAEDMKKLITTSRKKFEDKAVNELGMSRAKAKQQAERLIGATWDVGHINMLRKYGYENKHLKKQAEKIAPYVKHVHLSDNFGFEHTELPMGMGNVPTKAHLEAISKYNKQVKKIVEAGPWYQHFQTTPFSETLEAFGSPVYAMKMAPYWNQAAGMMGDYFAGQGATLPEQHFSMYGSGFSGLPTELGGQFAGRNRLSGAPME